MNRILVVSVVSSAAVLVTAPGYAGPPVKRSGAGRVEAGSETEAPGAGSGVAFSLHDADLRELVRVMSQLTGRRFIFGSQIRNVKATVFAPETVTVDEAYQAFLSILETNGLTVVPHGRFLEIVATRNIATEPTPTVVPGQATTDEDRYITQLHRLRHLSADAVSNLLSHFKSRDGNITTYASGNLLILTDTGSNIRRMMRIVDDIDVDGPGDQIWVEPIHYAAAGEIAKKVEELFEPKHEGRAVPNRRGETPFVEPVLGQSSDLHVGKVVADERTNSLVIVATERGYLRILELVKKLDIPESSDGEIRVVPLQHADAIDLTKTLTQVISGTSAGAGGSPLRGGAAPRMARAPTLQGIFEGRVKVTADKLTNSIVVTSSPRDYASLRAVVDELDVPRRQVFIEAVIMDLAVTRTSDLGANFHAADTAALTTGGDSLVFGGLNPSKTIGLPDPANLQGMALGVRGPGVPNSESLLGTGITIPAFGVLIDALAHADDTDVLSTPHILATDNVAAEINVGENVPVQTNAGGGGFGALGAFGFGGGFAAPRQDVGTKIKVIPHLNDSNEVRLELTEEISEAKAGSAGGTGALGVVPIVKRSARTTLVVQDQETVVIGGLMRNRIAHSEDKIPLLGDIPVLGALFRSTRNEAQKTNLLLVLTPYILREDGDLRAVFERKIQERQAFLDRYFVFSDDQDYQPPHDYSRSTGLLEQIRQETLRDEEREAIDALRRPNAVRAHEASPPLAMPAPR